MLDAWIIDKLRREREQREQQERPALRLPVRPPEPIPDPEGQRQEDDGQRGVTVIDYAV